MAVPHLRLIVGEFGSGKSLYLLEHGLELAEKYRKGIVCNFPINRHALRHYCRMKGYQWCLSLIDFNRIIYKPILRPDDAYKILEYQNKVVLFDEAGIFFNSRSWGKVPQDFLASLVQVRKDQNYFILACHFLEQIDKQLRENVQLFIECRGLSVPTADGLDRLLFRGWYQFKPKSYARWVENPQWQSNLFRTWLASDKKKFFPVVPFRVRFTPGRGKDTIHRFSNGRLEVQPSTVGLLFQCFDSAQRLDKRRGRSGKYLDIHLGSNPLPTLNGKVNKTLQDIFN